MSTCSCASSSCHHSRNPKPCTTNNSTTPEIAASVFRLFCTVLVSSLAFCVAFKLYEHEKLAPVRREVYYAEGQGFIYDISHRIQPNMPSWNSKYGIGQVISLSNSMKNGSLVNDSEMKLSTHTGTHVVAPGRVFDHYFDAGFDVDTLNLAILNAKAMKSLNIPRGVKRVLFRTLNTDRRLMWKKEFDTSYVGFLRDGAQWLVDNTDIKLVGVDYLSAAAYNDLIPSHRVFLRGREIILVEGLKLENINAGVYTLHCLPLRLLGAEGSPTRCILIASNVRKRKV